MKVLRRWRWCAIALSALMLHGCTWLNAHLPLPWEREEFTAGPMVQLGDTDGKTAVTIAWRTAHPADSLVLYQKLSAGEQPVGTARLPEFVKRHTVVLNGLDPSMCYRYVAESSGKSVGEGRFCTFKNSDEPFSFAVFGDSGYDGPVQQRIARPVMRRGADFILHTGDLVYPNGAERKYEKFLYAPYRELLANIFFFPSMGNHDVRSENGAPMTRNFRLPHTRTYYAFQYANAYIIALDSTAFDDAKQIAWLQRELEWVKNDASIRWRFVFFHHPLYTNKGKHDGNRTVSELLSPLFRAGKVDIVFAGHNHMYTRFYPIDGIVYIIEGVGGREHYASDYPNDPRVAATDGTAYGFGFVEIREGALRFRHITDKDRVIDDFILRKTGS